MPRRFPRVIHLENYDAEDMFSIFINILADTVDLNKFTNDSLKYILTMINLLNSKFTNQAGDMLNLANLVAEDAILNDGEYSRKEINYSFQKFMMDKGVSISF